MAGKLGFGAQPIDPGQLSGWDKFGLISSALKDVGTSLNGGDGEAVLGYQQQLQARQQAAQQYAGRQALKSQLGFGAQSGVGGSAGAPAGGLDLSNPQVQQALVQAALNGDPAADNLIKLYSAGQPSVQVGPDGRAYNSKDPSMVGQRFGNPTNVNGTIADLNDPENLNRAVPEAPFKGATPTYDNRGRVTGWSLDPQTARGISANAAATAAGQGVGAAPYTADNRTDASGAPVYGTLADRIPSLAGPASPSIATPGGLRGQSPGEKSYSETTSKGAADRYAGYIQGGQAAQTAMDTNRRIDSLLGNFEGGKYAGSLTGLASAANSLGFTGIDPKLGNKQAAAALSQQIALSLHSQLPGPLSNADRDFLTSMAPGLAQSASGRKQIIETQSAMQQRAQDYATFAQRWQQKYGGIDKPDASGRLFEDSLRVYAQQNPLFSKKK